MHNLWCAFWLALPSCSPQLGPNNLASLPRVLIRSIEYHASRHPLVMPCGTMWIEAGVRARAAAWLGLHFVQARRQVS